MRIVLLITLAASLLATDTVDARSQRRRTLRHQRRSQGLLIFDRRINLSVKDAEISLVLPFLARQGRFNLILHPAVRGRVTLHLENVRLSVAFRALIGHQGLVALREGNIVVVLPRAVYLRQLTSRLRARKAQQRLIFLAAPQVTR